MSAERWMSQWEDGWLAGWMDRKKLGQQISIFESCGEQGRSRPQCWAGAPSQCPDSSCGSQCSQP